MRPERHYRSPLSMASAARVPRSRSTIGGSRDRRTARAARAAARRAEADARGREDRVRLVDGRVVLRAERNAAFRIKDVVHAPRYGRDDVARSLIEQGAEADCCDEEDVARLKKEGVPAARDRGLLPQGRRARVGLGLAVVETARPNYRFADDEKSSLCLCPSRASVLQAASAHFWSERCTDALRARVVAKGCPQDVAGRPQSSYGSPQRRDDASISRGTSGTLTIPTAGSSRIIRRRRTTNAVLKVIWKRARTTPRLPLPPWPRGASTKPQTPRRHRALDKLKMGHALESFEVVRALLGNDLLRAVPTCVEINQCVGCSEEPAPPRHRAGVASMAWRSTRRLSANAP